MKIVQQVMLCLVLLVFVCMPVLATEEETSDSIRINWEYGPKTVNLGNNLATLDLPEKYVFAGAKDSKTLMEYMGNPISDEEIGFVAPEDENKNWFVLFEYDPMGYVKDDEADKIDADGLLKSITEATAEVNPNLKILGWQEPPHYDKASNHLVWSILAEGREGQVINYNTRLLGREGVTSVTLVAGPEELEAIKPELSRIIDHYEYKQGKRYTDFIAGKDRIAEVGLTALVAGGAGAAAAKSGLLAKIFGPLLLALKKFWIIILAVIGGLFAKLKSLFGGGSDSDSN